MKKEGEVRATEKKAERERETWTEREIASETERGGDLNEL